MPKPCQACSVCHIVSVSDIYKHKGATPSASVAPTVPNKAVSTATTIFTIVRQFFSIITSSFLLL